MVLGQDVKVLPPSGRWVTDQGGFFSQLEIDRLEATLRGYADTTSTQIVVVTVQTLGGAPSSEYAVALGREWGVGQGDKDNGIVMLLSKEERAVYIATGFGIEGAVPDALAGRIVRNVMIPRFREGQFYQGVADAIDVIIAASSGEFDADTLSDDRGEARGIPVGLLILLFILVMRVIARNRHNGGSGGSQRHQNDSLLPIILWSALGSGHRGGGGFGGGGFGGGGFGGGGFGGGGGSFGGGGAGGSW